MVTREFATNWCDDLKFAWEKCDFQKITDIFSDRLMIFQLFGKKLSIKEYQNWN